MITNKYIFALIIFIVGVVYVVPNFKLAGAVSGSNFNPERIIDLGVFTNRNSMSVSQIQAFLNSKVPDCDTNGDELHRGVLRRNYSSANPAPFTCLKEFYQNTSTGNSNYGGEPIPAGAKSAAQIIWEAGQAHGINPQVLLVTLQKETSLVTDEWPWFGQYERAMGYGCPDSGPNYTANCNAEYFGFYNQINLAAAQFRRYLSFPQNYNYTVGNNYVLFNQNPSCGGSNLNIRSAATAALYNYTPYQPNQASLDNYPGEAPCGAYGNRNFWFKFNEWFGTTLDDVRRVRADSGDLTQYVLYEGKKQGIPTSQVLRAWDIDDMPLETLSRETIDSIPNHSTILQQKAINYTTGQRYLVENGKYYKLNAALNAAWGFGLSNTAQVGQDLINETSFGGKTSIFATPDDSNTIYMVNGDNIHPIGNYDAYKALDRNEPPIVISSSLFNDFIPSDSINHNFATFNGSDVYLIDNGQLRLIPDELESTILGDDTTPIAFAPGIKPFFSGASSVSRFIRQGGAIYFASDNRLYGLPNPTIYSAYKSDADSFSAVISLGSNAFNLIEKGPTLRTQLVKDGSGDLYYLDSSKDSLRSVPAAMTTSLGNTFTNSALLVDQQFIGSFANSGEFTRFLKSYSGGAVFMVDNGSIRGISNPNYLNNIKPSNTEITRINSYDISRLPYVNNLSSVWRNEADSKVYIVDKGNLREVVNPGAAAKWLSSFKSVNVSDNTVQAFNIGDTITGTQVVNGSRHYIINGSKLLNTPTNFRPDWSIDESASESVSTQLINTLPRNTLTSNYVSNNGAIFLMNKGQLYGISSLDRLFNFGYTSQKITEIDNDILTTYYADVNLNGFLAQHNGETFVVERGELRPITDSAHLEEWTDGGALLSTTPNLSGHNISQFNTGPSIQDSISSSDSNTIYAIVDGLKSPIGNYQLFVDSYRPAETVSKYLLRSIPSGTILR